MTASSTRALLALLIVLYFAVSANAQGGGGRGPSAPIVPQDPKTLKRDPLGHPDFTGLWNNQYTPDLTAAVPGGPIPFTAYGEERWKKVDLKNDPTGLCLPVGPSRLFTSPFPVYFLQTSRVLGALFEYQTTYRMFYIDGKHPEDLGAYGSEFNGHSTAHWEGDVLVADTIGINERTWLDTAGHEHSDKLHLIEKFEKVTDDIVRYTVTFEDPVFFARPFSVERTFRRAAETDRILPYTCEENNKDIEHLVPTLKTQ